jgi:hypothetical protein
MKKKRPNDNLSNYSKSVIPLFKPQPPLTKVQDGYGFLGTLLLDTNNNKIQCHICGEWYKSLIPHIKAAHLMNSKEYKREMSLNIGTPLVSPSVSKKLRENMNETRKKHPKKMNPSPKKRKKIIKKAVKASLNSPDRLKASIQTRNRSGRCPNQIKNRLKEFAENNGKDFTSRELKEKNHRLWKTIEYWFDSFNLAKKAAGLPQNDSNKRLNDKQLLEILIEYHKKNKRWPSKYTLDKDGSLPCSATYNRHFEKYSKAKKMANEMS